LWRFSGKKPAAIGYKAPFLGLVEPALASPIEKVPSGARWVQEIKFDGYRVQLLAKPPGFNWEQDYITFVSTMRRRRAPISISRRRLLWTTRLTRAGKTSIIHPDSIDVPSWREQPAARFSR
jgi:hypothetical protein